VSRGIGAKARQACALARFEAHRLATRGGAVVSVLLFAGMTALGHFEQWTGSVPAGPSDILPFAFALGLIALTCHGAAQDRARAFDEYLVTNHVPVRAYVVAKIAAMAVTLTVFGIVAAAIEGASSGADARQVLWLAAVLVCGALLLAPWALLVEAFIDTSIPAAPVLLVYGVAVAVAYLATGSRWLVDVTGLGYLVPGDWATLGPLLGRTVLLGLVGYALASGAIALRLRRY